MRIPPESVQKSDRIFQIVLIFVDQLDEIISGLFSDCFLNPRRQRIADVEQENQVIS